MWAKPNSDCLMPHYITKIFETVIWFISNTIHCNWFTDISDICRSARRKLVVDNINQPTAQVNTLRPRQDGRPFANDIFKYILLNENVWIPNEISLKFVPKGSINNFPSLVQIMAWCRPGDRPLSELMMVSSLTHICVTQPQWVNAVDLNAGIIPHILKYVKVGRQLYQTYKKTATMTTVIG